MIIELCLPFAMIGAVIRRFPNLVLFTALAAAGAAICGGSWANGEAISDADRAFFENRIRPVLVKHCYECHSHDSGELGGKLLLDSRAAMLKGGQSGPALVAGKPEESLIIHSLRYDDLEMPPQQPLPEAVVNDFVRWIQRGAPDPRMATEQTESSDDLDSASLWSFRPRSDPPLPDVKAKGWVRDPLDQFVLARLEAKSLMPTGDADPRTLIRRLHYDLIGLPPTFAEVETFAAEYESQGSDAVERLVDDLLARPQFGERWGRHWLDVARYGESNGDDGLGRNASFPHAWRYRDYVIDALNRDVSYDQFLTEQIAGDLLTAESADEKNRQLVATGFLAIGSKPAAAMNKNFAMDIVNDQINVVSTAVMGLSVACARCHDHKHDPIPTRDYYALAGLFTSTETLYGTGANEKLTAPPTPLHQLNSHLARAGSAEKDAPPKFPDDHGEAISGLRPAIYAPLDERSDELNADSGVTYSGEQIATVKAARLQGSLAGGESGDPSYSVAFWFRNTTKNNARPITAYLFSRGEEGNKPGPGDHLGIGGSHDKARAGKLFIFNGPATKQSLAGSTVITPGSWNHVVLVRNGRHVQLFLNGGIAPEFEGELPATFDGSPAFTLAARSDTFAPLQGNVAHFAIFPRALSAEEAGRLHEAAGQPKPPRVLGQAMGVRDRAKPADCKIHIGGETGRLGPVVKRGVLSAYDRVAVEDESSRFATSLAIDAKQSGRLQLAQWLTRPDHPQTARVMVNRIWLHLFGQGIVTTPDDFGVYGSRPTHPMLLDHLAQRFVRDGWSVKRMIRAIVLSRTYQLDSRCDAALAQADPENRLLARHNRRRLDAESIRDSILQASGQLNLQPAEGSAVAKVDALINWPPGESTNLHRESNHRSVYLCMLRHAPPPELSAFDLPDGVSVMGRRNVTTLPTQTLFLMNSPMVVEQAELLAALVLKQPEMDVAARVRFAFQRTLSRNANDTEQQQSIDLVQSIAKSPELESMDSGQRQLKAWAVLCQGLLAANEFRYVD